MRILHAINSVNPAAGGPVEGIRQLGTAVTSLGHAVEVVSLDNPEAPWVGAFPLPVHALGPGMLTYGFTPRLVPWLRRNAGRFDIVIVNGIWQYQCLGAWLALRGSAMPYVVFTHGMLDPWFRRAYPLKHLKKWMYWPWAGYPVLRDASAVFFTCEEERILARQSFCLYDVCEAVVGYGVSGPPERNADSQIAAFLARFPKLQGKRLALYMGRLHPRKGCEVAVQAFASVLAQDPQWRLIMAGPDSVGWQAELARMAADRGAAQAITWTGMLLGDLKWGALRAAEVLLLPSHGENFGVVVAEALACGTPPLISDKVNIWREVQRDAGGLVAPDDVAGASAMLRSWSALPIAERTEMKKRARACFERRFRIEATARRFVCILESSTLRTQTPEPIGRYVRFPFGRRSVAPRQ
jgi:glycosyltransferase involved in cell wall biosynthesis